MPLPNPLSNLCAPDLDPCCQTAQAVLVSFHGSLPVCNRAAFISSNWIWGSTPRRQTGKSAWAWPWGRFTVGSDFLDLGNIVKVIGRVQWQKFAIGFLGKSIKRKGMLKDYFRFLWNFRISIFLERNHLRQGYAMKVRITSFQMQDLSIDSRSV